MDLIEVPQLGDIVVFPSGFIFMGDGGAFGRFIELDKNTMGVIADRIWSSSEDLGHAGDEVHLFLVIGVKYEGQQHFFRLNYEIHRSSVKIISNTAAAKVLFKHESE